MTTRIRTSVLAATAILAASITASQAATSKIGVASAVKNNVSRVTGGGTQPLATGSDVFLNERIRTGDASTAQLLFLDKTSLSIGPRAELTLDSFVYNPSSRSGGRVVLSAVRGAFRFITGSQTPQSYTIKTPIGTIGVRGTIGDVIVARSVTIVLVQGIITFTFNGVTYTLDRPGTSYAFNPDGTVVGPQTYDGTILATGGETPVPLYGWYFQGDQLNNGLPNTTNNIDQLDAIIRHSISPPDYGDFRPPTNRVR